MRVYHVTTGMILWEKESHHDVTTAATSSSDMQIDLTTTGGEVIPAGNQPTDDYRCPLCTAINVAGTSFCQNCGKATTEATSEAVKSLAKNMGLDVEYKLRGKGPYSKASAYRRTAKRHLCRAHEYGFNNISERFKKDFDYRVEMINNGYTADDIDELDELAVSEAQQNYRKYGDRERKFGSQLKTNVAGFPQTAVWEPYRSSASSNQGWGESAASSSQQWGSSSSWWHNWDQK